MVRVIAPPHTHTCVFVQAQEFPRTSQCFQAADCFGVPPPLRAPGHPGADIKLPAVRSRQGVPDKFARFG